MPYDAIEQFVEAVQACPNGYYQDRFNHAIPADVNNQDIQRAFAVYSAARHTTLEMLVMGRWVQAANEQNPGIDQMVEHNFRRMNEVDYGGSVMNSDNWTMLMNDAWVLGGVHSHTPFYLASPRAQNNLVHAQFGMTVTARELLGVLSFGYEIVRGHPTLGEVASVRAGGEQAANDASLLLYVNVLQASLANGMLTQQAIDAMTAPSHPIYNA